MIKSLDEGLELKYLKEQYDVIIVGAGGAGLAAAIEAYDNGAQPVVLEKMPIVRGNTKGASAGMNAAETIFQKKEGIHDSKDAFFEETLKGGKYTNNKELLRYFVDHSADAIKWLADLGMRLSNLTQVGGMEVKRTHRPADGSAVGNYLVTGLLKNIKDRNIPIFVNAKVEGLIEDDGSVKGVNVSFDGSSERTIYSKAVVVTTGGFGANKELVAKYLPNSSRLVSTNYPGATGDSIKMFENLGAELIDLEYIQIHPSVHKETRFLLTEAIRGEGAILLDQNGERFCNEMDTRDVVSAAIMKLKEQSAYLLFDAGVKQRVPAINFYLAKGIVEQGKSIEKLAQKLYISKENLHDTVINWNEAVQKNKDEIFKRKTAMENDLSSAPYYAINITPGVHHTMGGVKINKNTEVLRKDQTTIKGVYAAGEVAGGLHGSNRIGGNAIAEIIVFGRQAGKQAAGYSHKV